MERHNLMEKKVLKKDDVKWIISVVVKRIVEQGSETMSIIVQ